ncbi:MAG: hypothetical protein Q8P18_21260 [Pseudomonadota bacterium]|nr:hypothetical protein [Pseudomonadota bacterium]
MFPTVALFVAAPAFAAVGEPLSVLRSSALLTETAWSEHPPVTADSPVRFHSSVAFVYAWVDAEGIVTSMSLLTPNGAPASSRAQEARDVAGRFVRAAVRGADDAALDALTDDVVRGRTALTALDVTIGDVTVRHDASERKAVSVRVQRRAVAPAELPGMFTAADLPDWKLHHPPEDFLPRYGLCPDLPRRVQAVVALWYRGGPHHTLTEEVDVYADVATAKACAARVEPYEGALPPVVDAAGVRSWRTPALGGPASKVWISFVEGTSVVMIGLLARPADASLPDEARAAAERARAHLRAR